MKAKLSVAVTVVGLQSSANSTFESGPRATKVCPQYDVLGSPKYATLSLAPVRVSITMLMTYLLSPEQRSQNIARYRLPARYALRAAIVDKDVQNAVRIARNQVRGVTFKSNATTISTDRFETLWRRWCLFACRRSRLILARLTYPYLRPLGDQVGREPHGTYDMLLIRLGVVSASLCRARHSTFPACSRE
jgi:hypothetical protein